MIEWPKADDMILSPENWKSHAIQFRYAAMTLSHALSRASKVMHEKVGCTIDDPELQWAVAASGTRLPCMMCMGLSTEMLLKALCLEKGAFVRDCKGKISFKGSGASGHNFIGMCNELMLMLTDDEKDTITRLEDVVVWGKYPGTRNPDEYENPFDLLAKGIKIKLYHPHMGWPVPEFMERYNAIFDKIWTEFR